MMNQTQNQLDDARRERDERYRFIRNRTKYRMENGIKLCAYCSDSGMMMAKNQDDCEYAFFCDRCDTADHLNYSRRHLPVWTPKHVELGLTLCHNR